MTDEIEIEVDVNDGAIAEEIEKAMVRGIQKASGKRSATGITDNMETIAGHTLRSENKIWTGELIESFKSQYSGSGGNIRITFTNTSDHAAPVEYGAEYGEKGPPLAPLIAWIMTKGTRIQPPSDKPSKEEIRNTVSNEGFVYKGEESADIFDVFPEEAISQAFYLQEHIREHGIDATRFMEKAESWAQTDADRTVAEYITREFEGL